MDLSEAMGGTVSHWDVLGLLVIEAMDLQFGFREQAEPLFNRQFEVCVADFFEKMIIVDTAKPLNSLRPEVVAVLEKYRMGVFKAFAEKIENGDVFDETVGFVLRQFLKIRKEVQDMADDYVKRKYREHWEAFVENHWCDPKFGELRESMKSFGADGLFEVLYSVFRSASGIADRKSFAPILAAWRKRVLGIEVAKNV